MQPGATLSTLCGDRAVSESNVSATNPDGSVIEARMVDVFTLKDGKISVKNAFRKTRPFLTTNKILNNTPKS